MTDNVSSWLIESEKIDYLEDSDDTDADPDYVDCANEHIENEYDDSDDDFSESNINNSIRSIIIPRSRSRSRSPLLEPSYYLGKDNITKWFFDPPSNKIRTRRRNIVLHLPGVKRVARDAVSILDCWKLYFTNSDVDNIVKCTNIYLDKLRQNYSNQSNLRETSNIEINALFGLLYLAGVIRSNHLNDLWSDDGLAPPYFRAVMSKARFYILLKPLRFDDIGTRATRKQIDKLAPIRTLFDNFVTHCQNNYTVGENVTIDEMLEDFRGRCSFRQYIPNKPNKYGIKIQALVDSRTFYTANMEVYVGTQPDGPYKCDNSPMSIVKRMVAPISKTGRNVIMDNWYSSIPLSLDLLKNHNLTMVGTIRKNKREIPPCFLDTKKRTLNSSVFGYGEDILLTSYVPKKNKNVLLISTMHEQGDIDPESVEKKPEVIMFYNQTKGGVDVVDELKGEYSVSRISCRWSLTIFFSLMNIAGINSQIIYRENTGKTLSRREFLKNLGNELTKPFMIYRLQQPNLSISLRQQIIKLSGHKTAVNVDQSSSSEYPVVDDANVDDLDWLFDSVLRLTPAIQQFEDEFEDEELEFYNDYHTKTTTTT
ncbi:hypothetical protein QTP88_023721 [Uroleucon formosanum]